MRVHYSWKDMCNFLNHLNNLHRIRIFYSRLDNQEPFRSRLEMEFYTFIKKRVVGGGGVGFYFFLS